MGTRLLWPMATRGTVHPPMGTRLPSTTGMMTIATGTTRATATVATAMVLDTLTAMAMGAMRVIAVGVAGAAIGVTSGTGAMRAFEAIAFRITVSGAWVEWVELAVLGLEVDGALDGAKIAFNHREWLGSG